MEQDNYVAWCRYRGIGAGLNIVTCNSGDVGAFKVYRESDLDSLRAELEQVTKERDEYKQSHAMSIVAEQELAAMTKERDEWKEVHTELAELYQKDFLRLSDECNTALKENERLKGEAETYLGLYNKMVEDNIRKIGCGLSVTSPNEPIEALSVERTRAEKAERERDEWEKVSDGYCDKYIVQCSETQEFADRLAAERTAHEETKRALDKFRELLWFRHGCNNTALYGDDGEMQCNAIKYHPPIDFVRDTPEIIEGKFQFNFRSQAKGGK